MARCTCGTRPPTYVSRHTHSCSCCPRTADARTAGAAAGIGSRWIRLHAYVGKAGVGIWRVVTQDHTGVSQHCPAFPMYRVHATPYCISHTATLLGRSSLSVMTTRRVWKPSSCTSTPHLQAPQSARMQPSPSVVRLGNVCVIPIALDCNWLTRDWCAVRPTANGDASSATDSAIVTVKVKKPEEQLRLNTATGVRPVPQ